MKQQLIIKSGRSEPPPSSPVPHWQTFIRDKSLIVDMLEPRFDADMRGEGLDFWVTREFTPARIVCSEDEVRAGLDRIFRIILQNDAQLPEQVIARIRLNPSFEYVRAIEVSEAP